MVRHPERRDVPLDAAALAGGVDGGQPHAIRAGIEAQGQLVTDRQIGVRRVDLPFLSAQHRLAHLVEQGEADREIELLVHRLRIDFRRQDHFHFVRGAVAERIRRQAHRQLGVGGRRPQHARHHHVPRPVLRRRLRVLHLPPRSDLHVLPADLHANLMRPAIAVALDRLDAEHVVPRQLVAQTLEDVLGVGHHAKERAARSCGERLEPGLAHIAILRQRVREARLRRAAGRLREHHHVDAHTRLRRQRGQRRRLPLRRFEHQPLRHDDHRLRPFDVAQVRQQRGIARHRLCRQVPDVRRDAQRFLLDVAIARRHRVGVGVAARAIQQPLRRDRIRSSLERDGLVVADVVLRHHPVVRPDDARDGVEHLRMVDREIDRRSGGRNREERQAVFGRDARGELLHRRQRGADRVRVDVVAIDHHHDEAAGAPVRVVRHVRIARPRGLGGRRVAGGDELRAHDPPGLAVDGHREVRNAQIAHRHPLGVDDRDVDLHHFHARSEDRRLIGLRQQRARSGRDRQRSEHRENGAHSRSP